MNRKAYPYVIGLLFACASLTVPAEIYQCRDAKGKAVFSQVPCPKEKISGNTEAHKLWREMQVLVNEGSAIYQLLGADVDSILNCRKNAQLFSEKLDPLDARLSSLSMEQGKYLRMAQRSLRECGQCVSSSQYHCENAAKELNLQMNVLLPPLASHK
jgi:hypothetical protein